MVPRSPDLLRLVLVLALSFLPQGAAALPWALSPETAVSTVVTWRGSSVVVRFPALSGAVDFDEKRPEAARAAIDVSARAATTGVPAIDALVRSEGYLDARSFPTISFRLDRLTRTSKSTAEILGQITLRGVTAPLALHATVFRYGPADGDPERFQAGFDLTGEIDRTAFGSKAGLPDVAARLPLRIHLLMESR